MPYCMYLRKSRSDVEAEQRGEGETLARHESALLELSKKLHLPIATIHREVESGETISARPVMQQLLREVEAGVWDGVLVMEVERLARGDTIDQGIVAQAFKYSDTKIVTPAKIYDPANEYDEEYFEFGLFMSRREYKTINRRLQRGRLASVNEGKYVGNIPPYGYDRIKLEKQKGYTLCPNKDESPNVRLIYELYTKGKPQPDGTMRRLGVSLIAQELIALKIPARISTWKPDTISGILSNPVYMGKVKWGWRPQVKKVVDGEIVCSRPCSTDYVLVDGLHEALVDEVTWQKAQQLRVSNRPTQIGRNHKMANPFAGLIVCGYCGHKMARRPYSNGYPTSLICRTLHCKNVSSQFTLVEKRALQALSDWLEEYKLTIKNNSMPHSNELMTAKYKALDKLNAEIATFDAQMDNIHNLLEQGVYTIDMFLERSKKLSDRCEDAKTERDELQKQLNAYKQKQQTLGQIVPKVEHILSVYDQTEDPKLKNDLLKEVVDHIVYTKKEGGRWNPEKITDFKLDLYMCVPS